MFIDIRDYFQINSNGFIKKRKLGRTFAYTIEFYMKTLTAKSTNKNTKEAVRQVASALKTAHNIKAVLFFACSDYDDNIIDLMQSEFPNTEVFGCTSMAEIVSGEYSMHSLVATAFTDEIIEDIKIVISDKVAYSEVNIDAEMSELEDYYGMPLTSLDMEKYFGIALCCYGIESSIYEKALYENISDRMPCIFAGATASAVDFNFDRVRVFYNGKSHKATALIALIKSKVPVALEKIEAVELCNISATVTKMNAANVISEIDGYNAADFYSNLYSIPRELVVKWNRNNIMKYVLGETVKGNILIHTLVEFNADGSLRIDPAVSNMQNKMELLRATELISTTAEQMNKIRAKYPDISFMINFDCGYRYMDAQANNTTEQYAAIYKDIPLMGFSTFGEYFTTRVSQTSAMLIFK